MSQKGSAWRKDSGYICYVYLEAKLELGQVMFSDVFSEQIIPLNLPT